MEPVADPEAVSVDIYDQVYRLRGTIPDVYRAAARRWWMRKMRAVAAQGSTVDSLRVAVLASLNIADELLALRARYDALAGSAGDRPRFPCSRVRERWRACWMKCWKTVARGERALDW